MFAYRQPKPRTWHKETETFVSSILVCWYVTWEWGNICKKFFVSKTIILFSKYWSSWRWRTRNESSFQNKYAYFFLVYDLCNLFASKLLFILQMQPDVLNGSEQRIKISFKSNVTDIANIWHWIQLYMKMSHTKNILSLYFVILWNSGWHNALTYRFNSLINIHKHFFRKPRTSHALMRVNNIVTLFLPIWMPSV